MTLINFEVLLVTIFYVFSEVLGVFGFFIALGRSTRSFLLTNGFDTLDDPIEDFIRYNLYMLFLLLKHYVLIVLESYHVSGF